MEANAFSSLQPEYKLADPICTFVFSLLVLVTTALVVKDVVVILMQGTPETTNGLISPQI